MTDRLAEIKQRQAKKAPWLSQERQVDRADIDWLIQEVERLRDRVDALRQKTGWVEDKASKEEIRP